MPEAGIVAVLRCVKKRLRQFDFWLHRDRLERELRDEMAAHREMMSPGQRHSFGNAAKLQDEVRDLWGGLWLDYFRQDVQYAVRGFRRERRFAISALAAIALAVGAATAVFSVVDRSLFRPLPYRDGDRLVSVSMLIPHLGQEIMFAGAYRDWRVAQGAVELTSWSGVAACDLGGETPQRLGCLRAEATFLPLLGVKPLLGRNFTPAEDTRGAAPVVLLSYAIWRTAYGADRGVLGRTITLDGAATRIIGVLPANFEAPDLTPADLVVPQKTPQGPHTQNYEVAVLGRLRPGYTVSSATAALAAPFARFRADFGRRVGGDFGAAMRLRVETVRDRQVRQYRLALWVLLGAVTAFVLIACANVANLLLARSAGRRREFAIRAALGGSRQRLIAQLLTESAVLGLAGGAAGCGLAWSLLRAFLALAPEGTIRLRQATLDARVLGFALLLSLGTALIFGLAPSLDRLRAQTLAAVRAPGQRRGRLRQALIAGQLAVSLVLLAGAGLMLLSLWRLQDTPLGFHGERVVTASFTLPGYRYGTDLHPTGWSVREFSFFNRLEARLREIPGAVSTAIADSMPPGSAARTVPYVALAHPAGKVTEPGMSGSVKWRYVSPGYFDALAIPILRGRGFTDADRAPGLRYAVVNQSLARRLFGDRDPVGRRLGGSVVIGVAGDVRNAGIDRPFEPEFYRVRKATGDGIPGSGDDAWWRRATAVVRSNLATRDAEAALRAAIHDVDPALPVTIETLGDGVDRFLTRPRFQTTLLLLFALTGVFLAGIGLYGLMSFLVVERTREIGVRIALGATPGQVVKMVVADGTRWTIAGVAIGIAASVGLLRLLRGLLYEVKVLDFRVFATAVTVLGAVAVFASWLPAHRAARIDPMAALRHD